MRFRMRLDWEDEYQDRETAREDLLQLWNEIEGLSEGTASLEVMDIQPLPKSEIPKSDHLLKQEAIELTQGRRPEMPRQSPAAIAAAKSAIESDSDSGVNFTEDVMGQTPGVTHPWDQGLNIFPEDHPYRPIERLIQMSHGGPGDQEEERLEFWKKNLKRLAP